MTGNEIVFQTADKPNLRKKRADYGLAPLIEAIHDSLKKDGEIRIDGLGTFKVTERKARTGVNPRTKEKIQIPAGKAPTFRPAKALRDTVKDLKK
jgi:nucleoid DNA-binding protein